jgi:hypothetical protein
MSCILPAIWVGIRPDDGLLNLKYVAFSENKGLFKMIAGVLTISRTQYTSDSSI